MGLLDFLGLKKPATNSQVGAPKVPAAAVRTVAPAALAPKRPSMNSKLAALAPSSTLTAASTTTAGSTSTSVSASSNASSVADLLKGGFRRKNLRKKYKKMRGVTRRASRKDGKSRKSRKSRRASRKERKSRK